MWEDRRLLAALAAIPPEAFIDGPLEDGEALWRRTVQRLRAESGDPVPAPDPDNLNRPSD